MAAPPIDADTVRRVAKLARLAAEEARLTPLASELDAIVRWVAQLDEVDTDGVEPMTSAVTFARLPMRDDVVTDGDKAADVLANAPRTDRGFFVVPRSVE